MERWLSLTVSEPSSSEKQSPKARVYISIPKRTVKRAVARNRLKRVLREAVRRDPFFGRDGIFRLKVCALPVRVNLAAALRSLEALHD